MASPLDLQEQEQLDQLKAFWAKHGNLITWLLTLVLMAYAAHNGWNWYQREQSAKAAVLFAELERATAAQDTARVQSAWADMKERYARTAYGPQSALLVGQVWANQGRWTESAEALQWASENGSDDALRVVARLRWSALLIQMEKAQEALAVLDKATGQGFDPLVDDRRADAHLALGQTDQAKTALQRAYSGMGPEVEYRRVVQAKMMSLGMAVDSPEAKAKVGS